MVNGFPVTCCDLSDGPHRGTVYINWSDQRNGGNDTDVWIIKSTDGGTTWSSPQRVNDDPPGRHQFFTWMTIDQSTGYLYTVFYDRRNHPDGLTDVYMAVSKDGGDTFTNFKVSETPFNPNQSVFFGDYTHIAAHNGIVRPVWTRLHNGALSIMTALVDTIYVGNAPEKISALPTSLDQNFPNPVQDISFISYKVHAPARVSLKIYDFYGHEVVTLVPLQEVPAGKYIEPFDRNRYGLSPGFYYYSLFAGDQVLNRKMMVH
jgi:hypothetical protein